MMLCPSPCVWGRSLPAPSLPAMWLSCPQVTVHAKVKDVASDKMVPIGVLWEALDPWPEQPQPYPMDIPQEQTGWGETPGAQDELPDVPHQLESGNVPDAGQGLSLGT